MKTTRIAFIASIFLCNLQWSFAQENSNTQLLWIHEDHVLVDKTPEYIKASEGLVKLLSENDYEELNFVGFYLEDNTFMFVSMIENLAQLDKNPWAQLAQKAGEEKVSTVMSAFGGKYNSHIDYTAVFHPDLSYKPEQLQEEGNIYREWDFFYYNESNHEQMMDMAREWKKLYEEKNIEAGYTLYSNGLGHEGPVIVIHRWAKDPVDLAQRNQKINEIIGETGQKLWEKTMKLGYRMESKRGWLMPNISYQPQE
jgi:hypothetical protein